MFEKEGIKYAIEQTVGTECLSMPIEDYHFIDLSEEQQEKAQCFKDGAEFGYNKAFVEADKNLKAVVADFNKANEWHYDSNVPKDRAVLICLLVTPKKEADMKPYLIYRTSVSDGGFIKLFGETVYAWRDFEKVLLPKESE